MGLQPPLTANTARHGLVLLIAAGLSGCSGTRFGDQLARSFSSPDPAGTPSTATRPPRSSAPAPTQPRPNGAATPPPATASAGRADNQTPPTEAAAPAGSPAPYRVTLRLPAADSSAPAERVTEALRTAGVRFEVETIERITAGDASSGSGEGAGGGNDDPLTPRRRPAPTPR